jgi:PDZ domain
MKTILAVIGGSVVMMGCILQAEEKDYPLTVRVVEVFGSYGPFTCCETVTIRIGMQDFVLVNGYAPHHLESHHSFHRSGACLTHVKVGDDLHVQGPIAEGKGGKSGPTSADGRYMYFGVLNSQGKTCKAAVLGVGESSSLSPPEETTREKPTAQTAAQGTIGASSDDNPTIRHDGITLSRIVAGGPADQAGMRVADVVLAIDSHFLYTGQEMNDEILRHKPGTKITVRYRRYRTIYEASVVVGTAQ